VAQSRGSQPGQSRNANGDVEGALKDYNEAIRLGYKPDGPEPQGRIAKKAAARWGRIGDSERAKGPMQR